MDTMHPFEEGEDLVRAWGAAAERLPPGWRLDGIRCTSTGLAPGERGERWRALAAGPDGASLEAEADDPEAALDELVRMAAPGQRRGDESSSDAVGEILASSPTRGRAPVDSTDAASAHRDASS